MQDDLEAGRETYQVPVQHRVKSPTVICIAPSGPFELFTRLTIEDEGLLHHRAIARALPRELSEERQNCYVSISFPAARTNAYP